jgi:hypothetical protein
VIVVVAVAVVIAVVVIVEKKRVLGRVVVVGIAVVVVFVEFVEVSGGFEGTIVGRGWAKQDPVSVLGEIVDPAMSFDFVRTSCWNVCLVVHSPFVVVAVVVEVVVGIVGGVNLKLAYPNF